MSANVESHGQEHRNPKYPPNRVKGLLPPWQKGKSANPGGVQKGVTFVSEAYKRFLAFSEEELREYKPKNAAEAMALRQVAASIYGLEPLPSVKEITDRTEGKAPQRIEHSGTVNVDITVILVEARRLLNEQFPNQSWLEASEEAVKGWIEVNAPGLLEE